MNNGWVKLWRKSSDSMVFKNDRLWKLWTYCLMRANHSEKWVSVSTGRGETEVKIMPGQFIYGSKSFAKELNHKWQSVHNRMKKLEKVGNLSMESKTHYSVVTICNWEAYQCLKNGNENPNENPIETQLKPNRNPIETNKKEEKVKNEKKEKYFDRFWDEYGKKVDLKTTKKRFLDLSLESIEKIFEHIPKYKIFQPDAQYRKNPASYLNQESWNDIFPEKKTFSELRSEEIKLENERKYALGEI